MRALGLLTIIVALGGCTRDNPGFLDSATVGNAAGTGDATGVDAGGADAGGTSDSTDTAASETHAGDGDGDGDGTCPPDEPEFSILLDGEGTETVECYPWDVLGAGGQSMIYWSTSSGVVNLTGPCDEACINCTDRPYTLTLAPGGFEDDTPAEPSCIVLVGEGELNQADPSVCEWSAMTIFVSDPILGEAMSVSLSIDDYGVPLMVEALAEATQDTFSVDAARAAECACEGGVCCDPNNPPAEYKLYLEDGQSVYSGGSVFYDFAFAEYQFHNLASVDDGACPGDRQIAWALTVPDNTGPSLRR
jgi:hypothetical protein